MTCVLIYLPLATLPGTEQVSVNVCHYWSTWEQAPERAETNLAKQARAVLLGVLRAGCPVWEDPSRKTLPENLVTYQVKKMDLTPRRPD